MTKEQIFGSFCDGLSYNGQAVTEVNCDKEWCFYQQDLSLSIVDDEYFVHMTEAVWGVGEDTTTTVSKQEIEHIIHTIRKRANDLSSVNQSAEAVLRATYREVDGAKPSGILTSADLANILVKIQIVVGPRYLDALLKPFDRNNDGVVEFEELVGYLMEKPYK